MVHKYIYIISMKICFCWSWTFVTLCVGNWQFENYVWYQLWWPLNKCIWLFTREIISQDKWYFCRDCYLIMICLYSLILLYCWLIIMISDIHRALFMVDLGLMLPPQFWYIIEIPCNSLTWITIPFSFITTISLS